MGFTTEHRGRGPTVFVPGTGQFLNSTCIRTNQSSEGIQSIISINYFYLQTQLYHNRHMQYRDPYNMF